MLLLVDLDGVVYLGPQAIPGMPELLTQRAAAGDIIVYVTNNSRWHRSEYLERLHGMGAPATAERILTSARATALALAGLDAAPRCTMVLGGEGLSRELHDAGLRTVPATPEGLGQDPDGVVVGVDFDLDYERLSVAAQVVRGGAFFAATNRDLIQEVETGRFRRDLFYRLNVFPIHLPPLRGRGDDVVPLAERFLAAADDPRAPRRVASDAARLLEAYAWPGNVRELENEMQCALALVESNEPIRPRQLSERLQGALEPMRQVAREGDTLRQTVARLEAWLIRRSLDAHGGGRTATARTLGITREGLYKKMKRLGIE